MRNIIYICTDFKEVFTFREKYKLSSNNFSFVEFCSIFFIDNTGLKVSLDVHELSFGKKLFCTFSEWPPSHTICIFSFRESFSSLAFIITIRCNSKCSNFFITRCSFYKWIFCNISNKYNLVDCTHKIKLNTKSE